MASRAEEERTARRRDAYARCDERGAGGGGGASRLLASDQVTLLPIRPRSVLCGVS